MIQVRDEAFRYYFAFMEEPGGRIDPALEVKVGISPRSVLAGAQKEAHLVLRQILHVDEEPVVGDEDHPQVQCAGRDYGCQKKGKALPFMPVYEFEYLHDPLRAMAISRFAV